MARSTSARRHRAVQTGQIFRRLFMALITNISDQWRDEQSLLIASVGIVTNRTLSLLHGRVLDLPVEFVLVMALVTKLGQLGGPFELVWVSSRRLMAGIAIL